MDPQPTNMEDSTAGLLQIGVWLRDRLANPTHATDWSGEWHDRRAVCFVS